MNIGVTMFVFEILERFQHFPKCGTLSEGAVWWGAIPFEPDRIESVDFRLRHDAISTETVWERLVPRTLQSQPRIKRVPLVAFGGTQVVDVGVAVFRLERFHFVEAYLEKRISGHEK